MFILPRSFFFFFPCHHRYPLVSATPPPPPPRYPLPKMKDRKENDKSTLSIHLLEPTVYLKSADVSGRRRARNEHPQPSAIRGVLALHLSEPRKIYSIGIELTAKSYIRLPHCTFPNSECLLSHLLTHRPNNRSKSTTGRASVVLIFDDLFPWRERRASPS